VSSQTLKKLSHNNVILPPGTLIPQWDQKKWGPETLTTLRTTLGFELRLKKEKKRKVFLLKKRVCVSIERKKKVVSTLYSVL
jgi:hypothetical protein